MSRYKGYKHTKKTKNKISLSNKGKHNHIGKNNPFYGKHHNKKTILQILKKRRSYKGKNNPNYNNDKLKGDKNPMKCKNTSRKVSLWRQKNQFGKNNPMFGKNHSKKTLQKMKKVPRKHHIYLKENSNKIIKLSVGKHRQLHARAYNYIYDKYGQKGIDNYIKWFDKKYGLKNE